MRLRIRNCNNIDSGEFEIIEGRLNIKYAVNGTGKSAEGLEWQLLSNIFHKREKSEYHFSDGTPNRLMTEDEIRMAMDEVRQKNSPNSVIKKFVNETFHIDNDYLFQLNPCEYDTVPQYIINECDKEVFAD